MIWRISLIIGCSLRAGIRAALSHPSFLTVSPTQLIIAFLEPEKHDLIRSLPTATEMILNNESDIVIPARNQEGFKTLPTEQALSEQFANAHLNNVARDQGLAEERKRNNYFVQLIWLFVSDVLTVLCLTFFSW